MWIVSSKGKPTSDAWELSVVVKGTHGEKSYGWEGEDKHIIWSEGDPCRHTAHPSLIDDYFAMAQKLADKLNGGAK